MKRPTAVKTTPATPNAISAANAERSELIVVASELLVDIMLMSGCAKAAELVWQKNAGYLVKNARSIESQQMSLIYRSSEVQLECYTMLRPDTKEVGAKA